MKYGVLMFPTDYAIAPDELAVAAEERGFESLFFPEHTHIPASRVDAVAGRRRPARRSTGTPMTSSSRSAAAAAVTKTIKIGSRHLPRHRARSDRHRQGGRQPSTSCRAAA